MIWGAGVYASSQIGSGQSNQGFTVNANKAKGSSSETTTTHTNTQVTVGGTTVNDIGGNLILDGANLDTKHLTGTVGGDLIVKSRQDAYQYTHDQKQAGFSADVGFNGKPQSFSINGGKTDADADYAQVTHQSGIKAQESTLSVQGQGKFTGGYLITDAGKNQTQFAQGIQTQGIENHLNYEGDAISVGVGIGADTSNPNGKAKPALQGIGYGTIDPVNKTSTTHAAITDQAGLSHINTENFNQQEVQNQLNQIITNDFDKEQVLTELGAQVNITTEFHKEAPQRVAEFSGYQEAVILSKLDDAENLSDEQINQILDEAAKWSEGGIYRVALHTATAALATGTIEGAASAGTTAYAIPKIDEYLKEQGFDETARHSALLALSVGIGATVGGDTASTANNAGQTQWNYLSHTELAAWKTGLINCSGNKQCIAKINAEYSRLNQTNFSNFKNYCTINFNAQRCSNLIKRFQNGTQGNYNLRYMPSLYTDISRLGGTNASTTINSVKINNATGGYLIRDTGINNINRYNGNEAQALAGELANERLYGGGRTTHGVASVQARDSSKNEKHGDGGRAMQSAEKRIADLELKLKDSSLSRKEKDKIKQTIKNIRQDAQKKSKGEEHGRRGR